MYIFNNSNYQAHNISRYEFLPQMKINYSYKLSDIWIIATSDRPSGKLYCGDEKFQLFEKIKKKMLIYLRRQV